MTKAIVVLSYLVSSILLLCFLGMFDWRFDANGVSDAVLAETHAEGFHVYSVIFGICIVGLFMRHFFVWQGKIRQAILMREQMGAEAAKSYQIKFICGLSVALIVSLVILFYVIKWFVIENI